VIPNAVEASLFHPITLEAETPKDAITVVAMSRLVYRKGIDLLGAVLPELCNRHPELRFIIGGEGPKRSALEEVISKHDMSDRVQLVGAVPHNRVRDLLCQGQIFLNCSLTEAFCMSLVEAASVGLLVVSTRVGGVPEVLPDAMMLLADPSPEGIIGTVEEAVQRVQERRRQGFEPKTQHDAVVQMYSWPEVARRTENVYGDAWSGFGRDSLASRMQRYFKCGKWFGKICCCVAAADWLYWQWLEWWEPRQGIAQAPELYKLQG
jgi:phosphatidylinositol glycan class A protein